MRKIAIAISVMVIIITGVLEGCGWKTGEMIKGILTDDPVRFRDGYKYFSWCAGGVPLVNILPEILNKDYIVLLQNNTELRATGGFMGSYARLRFRNGTLQSTKFEDIYEPDGQLYGYVKPPVPLDRAFDHGSWKLRDSNWDPDFTVAGPQIAWFFNQGGEPVDGIIALNLITVQKILDVLDMPNKNLVNLAQTSAEIHKDKRGFLSTIAGEILSNPKIFKSLRVIYQDLRNKQILLWAKDPEVQKVISQKYWDGGLGDYTNDYLYIVESNLGANKANCCITRNIAHYVTGYSDRTQEKLIINYKNNNEFTNPKPPVFWGGDYINYLRVVIPISTNIEAVSVNGIPYSIFNFQFPIFNKIPISNDQYYYIENRDKFKIVGMWVTVPAQKTIAAEIIYTLPKSNNYSVLVKRQPGIESFPYKLIINGKISVNEIVTKEVVYR